MNALADIKLLDLTAISVFTIPTTRLRPACRWEIDPATGKPVQCWSMQPDGAEASWELAGARPLYLGR